MVKNVFAKVIYWLMHDEVKDSQDERGTAAMTVDYEVAKRQAEKKRDEAYIQKEACCRRENEYRAAERAYRNNLVACQIKKLNFEKRIQDIQQAIRKIEAMDDSISKALSWGQKTDEAYSHCIKCSDYASASFNDTFHVKSVQEDQDLQTAIQKLKAEWQRLEQALAALKKEIAQNEQQIADMQRKIGSCVAEAASCSARIATMSFTISVCKVQLSHI